MTVRHGWLLVVLGLVVVWPAPAPGRAEPAGLRPATGLELAGRYVEGAVSIQRLEGSATGVAYVRQERGEPAEPAVRRLDSDAPVDLPVDAAGELSLVGSQVAFARAVPTPELPDARVAAFVDTSSGAVSTGPSTYPSPGPDARSPYFLTGTGDGWLDVLPSTGGAQQVVRHTAARAGRAVLTLATGSVVTRAVADGTGALLLVQAQSGESTLLHVDDRTGSTALWTGRSALLLDLSARALAWSDGRTVSTRDRATPASPGRVRDPGGVVLRVAVLDDAVAWTQAASGGATTTWSAQGDAPPTRTAGADTAEVAALGSSFAVVAGADARSRGVYRLRPGAARLGARVQEAGPTAPRAVRSTAGRVVRQEPPETGNAAGRVVEQGVDRGSGGTLSTRGTERDLGSAEEVDAQGGRTALLTTVGAERVALVLDGDREELRLPVSFAVRTVAVSGHRLVLRRDELYDPGTGTVRPPAALVHDLRDPAAPPWTVEDVTSAAVSGRRLAVVRQDGTVAVLDLDRPGAAPVVVRPPGGDLGGATVLVSGDWVAWSSAPPDSGRPVETGVVRLGGTVRRVDADVTELALAQGLLAWVDRDDREVHLLALPDGPDTVLGTARRVAPDRGRLSLTDDLVAYVTPQRTLRVLPTPAAPRPTTLLGGTVGRSVPLDLRLDTGRPLLEHTVTITKDGRVVRRLPGTAPDGAIRATWDGRDEAGRPVSAGRYGWQLTGRSRTGPLVSGGPQSPLSGHVQVL